MRHDTIYGALQDELRLFEASAPANSEAVERLLAPAREALVTCCKVSMWNAMLDLRAMRLDLGTVAGNA